MRVPLTLTSNTCSTAHLHGPQVATAQRNVVKEVLGTLAVAGVNLTEQIARVRYQVEQVLADSKELLNQFVVLGGVGAILHKPRVCTHSSATLV